MLRQLWNSPYTFWALLALPSVGMISAGLGGEVVEDLLHPTGEFAARFMILALMLTPLKILFPKSRAIRWLMRRRRYLGVAAFGYAVLHTLYYVIDLGSMSAILREFVELGIWTGWLAFLIFVPLALTSNDFSVRALGPGWKTLQRLTYFAALATLAHWVFLEYELGPAIVHFAPLAALEAYRIWRNLNPSARKSAARAGA